MLPNSKLPRIFWAEVASVACFIINRSPLITIWKNYTEEVWTGNPPNYLNLEIFRCPSSVHLDNEKFEPRFRKCIFIGYKSCIN